MIQYTDVPLTIQIEDADLVDAKIYVSFSQNRRLLFDISDVTVQGDIISLTLTQDKTKMLSANVPLAIQVNIIKDGVRKATEIEYLAVGSNLLKRVLNG